MSLIEALTSNSELDIDVLRINREHGDNLLAPREVEFVFRCDNQQRAISIMNFIEKNRFGRCRIDQQDDYSLLLVTIFMPITEHEICTVSGLMLCISSLFSVEYDGWSSDLQRANRAC